MKRQNPVVKSLLGELSGYADLGMKQQALEIVRQILSKPRMSPAEFEEAIRVTGFLSKHETWSTAIEAAYNRHNRRFQQSVRRVMLGFYFWLGEERLAVQFIKPHAARDPYEFWMTMDILLDFDRMDEARSLARRCERMLVHAEEANERDFLIEALANYYAHRGSWAEAFAFWMRAPSQEPLGRYARINCVELFAVCSLDLIEKEFGLMKSLPPDMASEVIVPGNDEGMTREVEKRMLTFKRLLEKVVPSERRKNFGRCSSIDENQH